MFIIDEVLQGLPAEMAGPLKGSSECSLPCLEICFIHLKTQAFSFFSWTDNHELVVSKYNYFWNEYYSFKAFGPQKAFPFPHPDVRTRVVLTLVTLKSYLNVLLKCHLFHFFLFQSVPMFQKTRPYSFPQPSCHHISIFSCQFFAFQTLSSLSGSTYSSWWPRAQVIIIVRYTRNHRIVPNANKRMFPLSFCARRVCVCESCARIFLKMEAAFPFKD